MSSELRSPGFLFGSGRRPVPGRPAASSVFNTAPTQPISIPNPGYAPSGPSTDIFAPSPQQSSSNSNSLSTTPPSAYSREVNRFETPGGGSKTVHWSPALVQNERNGTLTSEFAYSHMTASPYGTLPRSAANSAAKALSNQNGNTPNGGAPPLRSLRSALEPVNKSRRMSLFDQLPAQSPAAATARSHLVESAADTWIIVFGFPTDYSSAILKLFGKHAQIISHQSANRGNWIYIRYSCAAHAQQALARNGMILDGSVRIGVMPCSEEELAANDIENVALPTSMQQELLDKSAHSNVIPAISSISAANADASAYNSSFNNTSITASSSVRAGTPRSGMRPLSMSFRQENTSPTPLKEDSFFGKLRNVVGL